MGKDIKNHHIKAPSTPWHTISYKKVIETAEMEGGIIHAYSEQADIRIRQQLCLQKKPFLKKRIGHKHWIYALENDSAACQHLKSLEQEDAFGLSSKELLEELIKKGSVKVEASKVPNFSRAYYASEHFINTFESIKIEDSEEKDVFNVTFLKSHSQ
jgi:hypothetical protein